LAFKDFIVFQVVPFHQVGDCDMVLGSDSGQVVAFFDGVFLGFCGP
jgi:hypothetical protein